jgi:hypothetical protein
MFDHETRTQIANDRFEQLRTAALTPEIRLRPMLGDWLIRIGQRLASEPRPSNAQSRSGLTHEALPRC